VIISRRRVERDVPYQTLLEQDLLVQPFDVTNAYTMAFLIHIYGETP
jgi:hypothetical protein